MANAREAIGRQAKGGALLWLPGRGSKLPGPRRGQGGFAAMTAGPAGGTPRRLRENALGSAGAAQDGARLAKYQVKAKGGPGGVGAMIKTWQSEVLRRLWVMRFGIHQAVIMSRVFAGYYDSGDTQNGGAEILAACARALPFRDTPFFGQGYFWPDTARPVEERD